MFEVVEKWAGVEAHQLPLPLRQTREVAEVKMAGDLEQEVVLEVAEEPRPRRPTHLAVGEAALWQKPGVHQIRSGPLRWLPAPIPSDRVHRLSRPDHD